MARNLVCMVLALALGSVAAQARAAKVRQDIYEVSIGASATTGAAPANFAGLAKRVYVTSSNLGTTCVVNLRALPSAITLFTSDALSTGTTAVSLSDLPVAGRTEWLVTAGAAQPTTRTVSILLYYDANE